MYEIHSQKKKKNKQTNKRETIFSMNISLPKEYVQNSISKKIYICTKFIG